VVTPSAPGLEAPSFSNPTPGTPPEAPEAAPPPPSP